MDNIRASATRIYAYSDSRNSTLNTQNFDENSASGFWLIADSEQLEAGWFAAGTALTQGTLDELNAGSVLAQFSGPMASGTTSVDLSVQFGSGAFWEGQWSGAHDFQAGGDVIGPSLNQTSITGATGSVAGFVAGDAENLSTILSVDVVTSEGAYKDVGRIPGGVLIPD